MSQYIEKTLVLLKPDAVERALMGKIIGRFEDAGFKILAMKMVKPDREKGKKHYFDVAERHGEKVEKIVLDYITCGPVVAMVIEGIDAVENVRKFAGTTEPKAAAPGTIRGDFCHTSFAHADEVNTGTKNVIHASGSRQEAEKEIRVWFTPEELMEYTVVHEIHTR